MKKNLFKKIGNCAAGFTLTELMVVMAIICLLSGLAVASYRNGNKQIFLNNQAAQFVQDVRRVQEWALSARQFGNLQPRGYGIYVNLGGDSYILYSDNDGDGRYTADADPSEVRETVALHGNIDIPACKPDDLSINYVAPDLTATIVKTGTGAANYKWATVDFTVKNSPELKRLVCANAASLVYVAGVGETTCPQ